MNQERFQNCSNYSSDSCTCNLQVLRPVLCFLLQQQFVFRYILNFWTLSLGWFFVLVFAWIRDFSEVTGNWTSLLDCSTANCRSVQSRLRILRRNPPNHAQAVQLKIRHFFNVTYCFIWILINYSSLIEFAANETNAGTERWLGVSK